MVDKFLSLEEVAKMLDVSERTVAREVKAGRLRAFKIGRMLRFKPEAIEEYAKNQEVGPDNPAEENVEGKLDEVA